MPSNLSKTLYSIIVSPPLTQGEGGISYNFEQLVENLSIVVAADGPEQCTFELNSTTKDKGTLARYFYRLLGNDVRIETGNRIWRGYISQLTFSAGTQSRRLDIQDIVNEVTVHYSGGTSTVTIAGITDESRIRFGNRIYDQAETEDLPQAEAELIAQSRIATKAFGQPEMIGRDTSLRLRFFCVGYLSALDWCTTTLVSGETVKECFERIIDDCGGAYVSYSTDTIQDNGRTWNDNTEGTGLQLIRRLEQVLDTTSPVGKPWRFYIDTNNVAHWEPIDFTPAYEIKEGISEASSGVFRAYYGGRKIQPFEPIAGRVIRDATYPIERAYSLSPFLSAQDAYILKVKFDAFGNPSFESGDLLDFGRTDTYAT